MRSDLVEKNTHCLVHKWVAADDQTGISRLANISTLALGERAPHGFGGDVNPIRASGLELI